MQNTRRWIWLTSDRVASFYSLPESHSCAGDTFKFSWTEDACNKQSIRESLQTGAYMREGLPSEIKSSFRVSVFVWSQDFVTKARLWFLTTGTFTPPLMDRQLAGRVVELYSSSLQPQRKGMFQTNGVWLITVVEDSPGRTVGGPGGFGAETARTNTCGNMCGKKLFCL